MMTQHSDRMVSNKLHNASIDFLMEDDELDLPVFQKKPKIRREVTEIITKPKGEGKHHMTFKRFMLEQEKV